MDSLESMCNLKIFNIDISWIHYSQTFGIHYIVTTDICKIYELLRVTLGTKLFTVCQILMISVGTKLIHRS